MILTIDGPAYPCRTLAILATHLWTLLCLSWGGVVHGAETARCRGYDAAAFAGQRYEYVLKWGVITAGHAVLEATRQEDGRCIYRVTARSTSFIDIFYPVRIQAWSVVECSSGRVLEYHKRAKEGFHHERTRDVRFLWAEGVAATVEKGHIKRKVGITPCTQDPISVYFAWRAGILAGTPPRASITDGKRVITGRLEEGAAAEVSTPAGRYRARYLVPILEGLAGVFSKSPDARIEVWARQGDGAILKLRSKVKVGHFTALLVREGRRGATSAPPTP